MASEAERAFYDTIRWANALRKKRRVFPLFKVVAVAVLTLAEVLARLTALGARVPRGTVQRWAAQGLLQNRPTGRGRHAKWPDDAVPEIAAVWALKNIEGVRVSDEAIMEARRLAAEMHRRPVEPDRIHSGLALIWLCTYYKALHDIPLERPVAVFLWRGRENNTRVEVMPIEEAAKLHPVLEGKTQDVLISGGYEDDM